MALTHPQAVSALGNLKAVSLTGFFMLCLAGRFLFWLPTYLSSPILQRVQFENTANCLFRISEQIFNNSVVDQKKFGKLEIVVILSNFDLHLLRQIVTQCAILSCLVCSVIKVFCNCRNSIRHFSLKLLANNLIVLVAQKNFFVQNYTD